MKYIFLTILLFIGGHLGVAQIVQSSCEAPDEIKLLYADDAANMTFSTVFMDSLVYMDSVQLPNEYYTHFMDALMAVYNADLPARDTVVDMLNIHEYPVYNLHSIIVTASPELLWMKNLKFGNIPTGNNSIDSLIDLYGLSISEYYNWPSYDAVVFHSTSAYNTIQLCKEFGNIPSVYFAEPNGYIGSGSHIRAKLYDNYTELIYLYGWGDCLAGCTASRWWTFKIFPDCKVEYIGSEGSPLNISSLSENITTTVKVFPNPFEDKIHLKETPMSFEYQILDITGHLVTSGTTHNGRIDHLNSLDEGVYFVRMHTLNWNGIVRIIKR